MAVDLSCRLRPGVRGYPFNAARGALKDQAAWTFANLVQEIERENESVGKGEDGEFIDPEGDEGVEDGNDIAEQLAAAFADPAVRAAVSDAAGGIADLYAAQAGYSGVDEPVASVAPRGTLAVAGGDAAGRAAGGVRVVVVTEQVDQALRRAEADAGGRVRDRPGGGAGARGGGLMQAVSASRATGALDALTRPGHARWTLRSGKPATHLASSPACGSRRRPTTGHAPTASRRTMRSG